MRNIAIAFVLIGFFGCASVKKEKRPDHWIDEYGLIHQENPTLAQIATIKVHAGVPRVGCIRLRDIELDGRFGNREELKRRAAMQYATHVQLEILKDKTIGIPYDCRGIQKAQKRKWVLKLAAIKELKRRYRKAGKVEELKDIEQRNISLPSLKYIPYQE